MTRPGLDKLDGVPLCPSEGGADAATPGAAGLAVTPVGALLASHVLRDGELVLLVLRPSRWFIVLSSLRFLAVVGILMALAVIYDSFLRGASRQYLEAGAILLAFRLAWGTLQWTGRLYVLTDLRILTLKGVFNVEVFDCPLRKVARTLRESTVQEKICRIGSIVIVPQDEEMALGTWRMVAHPARVHQTIQATIARAKR
jgi:hypothetical protein